MVDPGSDWINRLITQPLGLPPAGVGVDGGTMMALWSIGPGFLIMYGAMQGVSQELHESIHSGSVERINMDIPTTKE